MTDHEQIIEEVEKYGIQAAGRTECLKIHRGEKVSLSAAVKAKCYECMAYYQDGKADCECPTCELYAWMPFGAAWKNRERPEKRELSPAEKAAKSAAFEKARKARWGKSTPTPS